MGTQNVCQEEIGVSHPEVEENVEKELEKISKRKSSKTSATETKVNKIEQEKENVEEESTIVDYSSFLASLEEANSTVQPEIEEEFEKGFERILKRKFKGNDDEEAQTLKKEKVDAYQKTTDSKEKQSLESQKLDDSNQTSSGEDFEKDFNRILNRRYKKNAEDGTKNIKQENNAVDQESTNNNCDSLKPKTLTS